VDDRISDYLTKFGKIPVEANIVLIRTRSILICKYGSKLTSSIIKGYDRIESIPTRLNIVLEEIVGNVLKEHTNVCVF
jgi:hypothetical protein